MTVGVQGCVGRAAGSWILLERHLQGRKRELMFQGLTWCWDKESILVGLLEVGNLMSKPLPSA